MKTTNIKTQSKETRGATIVLALALSCLELPLYAGILTLVATYQSLKNDSNPVKDLKAFAGDFGRGFKSLLSEERETIMFPVESLKGMTGESPIEIKKSGKTLDTDWISELSGRSNLGLLGDQGEGKSMLLRFLLYQFLRRYDFDLTKCRVYIHDIENGLGHGEKSTWLGLNQKCVYSDPDEFLTILETISESIDSPDFVPTLLIVDEFNNLLDEFDNGQIKQIDETLKRLRNRGKKRNMFMLFSSQDIDVSGLGLSQAIIRKLDWVVYPKMSQSSANFRNFGLSSESEKTRESLARELKSVEKISGVYPVLLYTDKQFRLVRIPDLSGLPETLPIATELTPVEWFDKLRQGNPNLDPSNYSSVRKLSDAVNDVLRANKSPLISRKLSDPFYVYLKTLKEKSDGRNHGKPRDTDDGETHNHTPETGKSKPETDFSGLPIPCDFDISSINLETI